MSNLIFIEGKQIYLRPLESEDANGGYPQWLNNFEVCQGNSHHVYPYTHKKALDYIECTACSEKALILAIALRDSNKHIGNIALQQINWIYRTAELAILLGEKEHWGKGYGLEASLLLLAHGFSALNLNRISCATFKTNTGMQRLALTLGMKEEGIRRHAAYKEGKYIDILEFGLLKEEFLEGNHD